MSRRNVTLYIDGKPADITTDSLILLNYAASDLSSPAAVKNTYSQQVNMPATARNDAIFSSIYRADYRTIIGDVNSFNPLIRTPFTIYDETGAILESGYLKLNAIKNKNGVRTYVATLYGGLGSFFYILAYDDQGETLSLGALPLLSNDATEKIDFRIKAETVEKAWKRLNNPNTSNAEDRQFDAVNFAPAYNGLPAGEFDASKGVGRVEYVGGKGLEKDDNDKEFKTYGQDNESLYDFGDDYTEWEVKDLRSYMQRPVVAVKALIEGIVRYAEARGFSVYLDPLFFSAANPYYEKAWMTLKLLAGRSASKIEGGTLKLSGGAATANIQEGTYSYLQIPLSPNIEAPNTNVTVKGRIRPFIWPSTKPADQFAPIYFNKKFSPVISQKDFGMYLFVQLQLLDDNGDVIECSPIQVCTSALSGTTNVPEKLVELANLEGCIEKYGVDPTLYMGDLPCIYISLPSGIFGNYWIERYVFQGLSPVEVSAYGAVSARICVEPREMIIQDGYFRLAKTNLQCAHNTEAGSTLYPITQWGGTIGDTTLTYESPSDQYRSGVQVTQEDLFADMMSPMDFLLSYTKTFGLHYLYDTARKRVQILTRNNLYGNRKTIDLQQRIDRSREITTTPIPMSSKWLEFAPASIEGEFAEYYKTKYGREYGAQKVNTGFDFDANTTQALDGTKFNGAPEVLERSKYFLSVANTSVGNRIPPPTIEGKTTYRLYRTNEDGEREDLQLDYPNPTGAGFGGFDYMNANKGYDGVPKLQCHGDDNSGTDGSGILLFHRGLAQLDGSTYQDVMASLAYNTFILTDDSATMYELNEKPCWELFSGIPVLDILPSFGRFDMDKTTIKRSMEFGVPAEIDNPVIAVDANTSVYEQFWAKYIADRNHVDTRVCTAYVDLRGFQPSPEMLRDFYYFDGAIWALNKIANYSLTTPGTTQCEFVKVQDQTDYTSGQILNTAEGYDITLKLRTDGTNLYVQTSRPLLDDEMCMILTYGSGVVRYRENGKSKHAKGKNYLHIPRFLFNGRKAFEIASDGRLIPWVGSYSWSIKDHYQKGKFVEIWKANNSHGFGYRWREGLNEFVTYRVAVYKQGADYKPVLISNVCKFESRVHISNGVMTQEKVVTETL